MATGFKWERKQVNPTHWRRMNLSICSAIIYGATFRPFIWSGLQKSIETFSAFLLFVASSKVKSNCTHYHFVYTLYLKYTLEKSEMSHNLINWCLGSSLFWLSGNYLLNCKLHTVFEVLLIWHLYERLVNEAYKSLGSLNFIWIIVLIDSNEVRHQDIAHCITHCWWILTTDRNELIAWIN